MESTYAIAPFTKGTLAYRIKRYLDRADELRAIARDMRNPECQRMLVGLAISYEQMAMADQCRSTAAAIN